MGTPQSLKFSSPFRVPRRLLEESGEGRSVSRPGGPGLVSPVPSHAPTPGWGSEGPWVLSPDARGACQAHGQAARRPWGLGWGQGRLTSGPRQVRGGDTEAEQRRQGCHGGSESPGGSGLHRALGSDSRGSGSRGG